MSALSRILLRLVDSMSYRLRRREVRARFRNSPLGRAGIDNFDTHELLERLRDRPPRIIYDLGANRGHWTLLARSLFPDAQVEAFEPLPQHCADFRRLTASLSGIRLHEVALGAAATELEMDLTSFSDSASLLAPTEQMNRSYGVSPGPRVRVPVARLDDWVAAHHLPPPDLLKLDLQGYEKEALRGAPQVLRHARAVLLELSFREFYTGQPTPGELLSLLEQDGFRLAALAPDLPAGRPLDQADALFLRPN